MRRKSCSCPKGWPKPRTRSFEGRAEFIAWLNRIPNPVFKVRAHRFPCELTDEVTHIAALKKVTG